VLLLTQVAQHKTTAKAPHQSHQYLHAVVIVETLNSLNVCRNSHAFRIGSAVCPATILFSNASVSGLAGALAPFMALCIDSWWNSHQAVSGTGPDGTTNHGGRVAQVGCSLRPSAL